MAIKDRAQLKAYFESGKIPTQVVFADLIDSLALTTEIPVKTYRVFSALLRMDNDTFVIGEDPRYVVRYTLLEPNTIGDLEFSLTLNNRIRIENNMTAAGLLPFERRFLTVGMLRTDFNFDSVFESDEQNNHFIELIFNIKSDGISMPDPLSTPLFYNLPIEIRVYDEL